MSTPPRRFKLVEDPEGDLTEDYLRTLSFQVEIAIPEPEPTYPEEQWTEEARARTAELEDELDEAVARAIRAEVEVGKQYRDREHWRKQAIEARAIADRSAPDLRPTEEQVLRALSDRSIQLAVHPGRWLAPINAMLALRENGWLRDTEAPPAPPSPEEQAVLDAAVEWEGARAGDIHWAEGRLYNAVRAYQATKTKEADQ